MQAQIEELRAAFGKVKTMDPDGKLYAKLCDILDKADDDALRACREAKIPFVSSLALNRLIKRGVL